MNTRNKVLGLSCAAIITGVVFVNSLAAQRQEQTYRVFEAAEMRKLSDVEDFLNDVSGKGWHVVNLDVETKKERTGGQAYHQVYKVSTSGSSVLVVRRQ